MQKQTFVIFAERVTEKQAFEMKTKLKILVENTVFQPEVKAELGFSLYIETADNRRILFDTGQSGLFASNAEFFGIDTASIDTLVLSHGHYDHTGGLGRFLALNTKAGIYAKQGFDQAKYSGTDRYIGKPDVQIPTERLLFVDRPTEIAEGVFVMPEIKITDLDDTHFFRLNKLEKGELVADEFDDELYLAIVKSGKLNIVSGCAHRGISNIIRTAQEHFPLPIGMVLGGMHTSHDEPSKVERLARRFNQLEVGRIVPCHCTGIDQYALLKSHCTCPVEYGRVGMNFFIE